MSTKIIMDENVSADAYTTAIKPTKDRTICGTYKANHGSGTEDLEATLVLYVCDADDPGSLAKDEIGWVAENTHSFNSALAGSSVTDEFAFDNCIHNWYRIMVDVSGGTDGQVRVEVTQQDRGR